MWLKKCSFRKTACGAKNAENGPLNKGFTVMEVVIVIAVIAILAAVLIPTFAGVIERTNRSNDLTMVGAWNALAKDFDGEVTSFDQALELIGKENYTVDDLIPATKDKNMVVWDEENQVFALVKKPDFEELNEDPSKTLEVVESDDVDLKVTISTNRADVWVMVDADNFQDYVDAGFSVYFKENFDFQTAVKDEENDTESPLTEMKVTAGVSIGQNTGSTLTKITYTSTTSPDEPQKVTFVLNRGCVLDLNNPRGDDVRLEYVD